MEDTGAAHLPTLEEEPRRGVLGSFCAQTAQKPVRAVTVQETSLGVRFGQMQNEFPAVDAYAR
jgi:hypothetical protein